MEIRVEFNPDLTLRPPKTDGRLEAECIPEDLHSNGVDDFLKKGQRNYWLEGEIPLKITGGNQKLSRPLASIIILEATHFIPRGVIYTKGTYEVHDVYDPNDPTIHFEGLEKIK